MIYFQMFRHHISKRCFKTISNQNTKIFKVYRWNPSKPKVKPYLELFSFDVKRCGPMILDALMYIQSNLDHTLAFRRSCREGVCGSCAMNVNGVNCLACTTRISNAGLTKIYPLPHSYVIRDLVTDFSQFLRHYKNIRPYLIRHDNTPIGAAQHIQSIKNRVMLNEMYECILCGSCSYSCPEFWWHGEKFLGPAALLHAYRWTIDSRDQGKKERVNDLKDKYSIYKCHAIMNCSNCCPKGLRPGSAIGKLKVFLAGLA